MTQCQYESCGAPSELIIRYYEMIDYEGRKVQNIRHGYTCLEHAFIFGINRKQEGFTVSEISSIFWLDTEGAYYERVDENTRMEIFSRIQCYCTDH